jgi:glutamate formiminotransferase
VVNVSEGSDPAVLADLARSAGPVLLDLHHDPHHHRSVFTLVGEPDSVTEAARDLAGAALAAIDLRTHAGAHPRSGVVDVVPFVPYVPGAVPPRDLSGAVVLRDAFARWLGVDAGIPTYLYGPAPGRTLPEVRRVVRATSPDRLAPDFGPPRADPRSGVSAVGARTVLVAYNIWVSSVAVARQVAPLVRSAEVRALGLAVGGRAQVSCNLVEPMQRGPTEVYDAVAAQVALAGGTVEGGELVGLIPHAVLAGIPTSRWAELGLSADSAVEARLAVL